MGAVLLDPKPDYLKRDNSGAVILGPDGRPEFEGPFADRPPELAGMARTLHSWQNPASDLEREAHALPPHIRENLERAKMLSGPAEPRMAAGWQSSISRISADGAQVLNSTSEAIMVPDYSLPASWVYGGKQLKYVLWGRVSTVVTTPGTIIFRLRFGGLAGTLLVTSKSQRPKTTVSTNMAAYVEMLVTFRRPGNAQTSGVAIAMGSCIMGNTIGDAAAAGEAVWPDAPAEVTSGLNTDAGGALTPTVQFSVATATTAWTTHMARLEDLT
jgi:hypothetical protein